jgi:maleylpyruvate isomerase
VIDMAETSLIPEDDLTAVAEAEARFLASISGLGDTDVRRSSLLPDWTVGHVLAHVARNADSHRRRADAAQRGEIVDQYPGSYAGRAAEIEASSLLTAAELIDDVRTSSEAMVAAWRTVTEPAWANVTRDVSGKLRPLHELPLRRWQEVEIHLTDLDIGVTYREWPDPFVAVWLPRMRQTVPDRLAEDQTPPPPGVVDERDELAWLYGRLQPPGLPEIAPWG